MKNILKTFLIQLGLFAMLVATFGVVYAAWDDVVSSGDPITSSQWNDFVNKITDLDSDVSALSGLYLCPLIEPSCHWQSSSVPRCSGQVTDKSSCVPGLDDRALSWCSATTTSCTSL